MMETSKNISVSDAGTLGARRQRHAAGFRLARLLMVARAYWACLSADFWRIMLSIGFLLLCFKAVQLHRYGLSVMPFLLVDGYGGDMLSCFVILAVALLIFCYGSKAHGQMFRQMPASALEKYTGFYLMAFIVLLVYVVVPNLVVTGVLELGAWLYSPDAFVQAWAHPVAFATGKGFGALYGVAWIAVGVLLIYNTRYLRSVAGRWLLFAGLLVLLLLARDQGAAFRWLGMEADVASVLAVAWGLAVEGLMVVIGYWLFKTMEIASKQEGGPDDDDV